MEDLLWLIPVLIAAGSLLFGALQYFKKDTAKDLKPVKQEIDQSNSKGGIVAGDQNKFEVHHHYETEHNSDLKELLDYTKADRDKAKEEKEIVVREKEELSEELQKYKDSYEKVIQETPNQPPQFEKARALSEDGKYEEADQEYEQAMAEQVQQTAKHLYERGLNLVLALRYDEALQLLAQAAMLAKDDSEILEGYAILLDDLGQFETAEKVFRRAIDLTDEEEKKIIYIIIWGFVWTGKESRGKPVTGIKNR